jgi:hypothetical protein
MSSDRRDFPRWKVEQVYIAQDGVCARCGSSLEHGFHRHHKDGNPLNNSIENLELLCPECHRATLGDAIINHRKQEEKILNDLNRLIDECFAGRLSGAVVERLIEAMKMSLKISRSLNKIDQGIESPPASIALLKRMQETKMLQEAYLEGFKDGVRWILSNKNRIEGEASNSSLK